MASLRSLGVHTPAALAYLIAESILPEDASEDYYTWETYSDPACGEEEVVTTDYCVVWSRGGIVRKVYRFEIEDQRVLQALLTWFPSEDISQNIASGEHVPIRPIASPSSKPKDKGEKPQPKDKPLESPQQRSHSRALVVFLKFQAHVFFLSGATHVVNLPFEVERAFPAPRGLILQRKLSNSDRFPSSPTLPPVPVNSFFSSQSWSQAPPSLSQPRQRVVSSGSRKSKSFRASSTNATLLEDLLKASRISSPSDGLPRFFSFTDPLSEMGLVVTADLQFGRNSNLNISGPDNKGFGVIDQTEQLLYVSATNELGAEGEPGDRPLMLVVTSNEQTGKYTVWFASYIDSKPASSRSGRRTSSLPAAKLRRRSSYGPTAPGTGATTPALRTREGMRESFGGPARPPTGALSLSASGSQAGNPEDTFASQLDPDFEISRQPGKDPRRVSSLLSRGDLGTSFDKSAFQDLASHHVTGFGAHVRRGQSFGAYDRTSLAGLSQLRARASTPGSVVSRLSFGAASVDDTLDDMVMAGNDDLDDLEFLEDLITGVHTTSAGSGFQEPLDGLKKELLMIKISEAMIADANAAMTFSFQKSNSPEIKRPRVFTLMSPSLPFISEPNTLKHRVYVHIVDSRCRQHLQFEFSIKRRRTRHRPRAIRSECTTSGYNILLPSGGKLRRMYGHIDAIRIFDGHVARALCLTQNSSAEYQLSIIADWTKLQLPPISFGPLKLFNPYLLQECLSSSRRTAGFNRTIEPPSIIAGLVHVGPAGLFALRDGDGRKHRLQLHLRPRSDIVLKILEICRLIFPRGNDLFLPVWWSILGGLRDCHTLEAEWIALVVTVFSGVLSLANANIPGSSESGRVTRASTRSRRIAQPRPRSTHFENSTALESMLACEASRSVNTWTAPSWDWVSKAGNTLPKPGRQTSILGNSLERRGDYIPFCANLARVFLQTNFGKLVKNEWITACSQCKQPRSQILPRLVLGLHLLREEQKLSALTQETSTIITGNLSLVIAQICQWLRWSSWGGQHGSYYDLDSAGFARWTFDEGTEIREVYTPLHEKPPSIYEWIENIYRTETLGPFPALDVVIFRAQNTDVSGRVMRNAEGLVTSLTPRTSRLLKFLSEISHCKSSDAVVELMAKYGINVHFLETCPETILGSLREAIVRCQASPPTTWSSELLALVRRNDIILASSQTQRSALDLQIPLPTITMGTKDIRSVCQASEQIEPTQSSPEADRYMVTRLIFNEDRRFLEAVKLLEPLRQQVAECIPDPSWTEAEHLEQQKNVMQWVMIRTFSLPSGQSMLYYDSRRPLITEKYPLHGFTTLCTMKPLNNTVSADRSSFTEEKYAWAFFHAGVAAGLGISRKAKGIDTSWIMFNKPSELNNRHAGLLFGLGLNGHLKTLAKWLSFKYLTPKHPMTSIGLLLGLSTSYLGTMDMLVTRLLSVHVTRMLPPGSAELNLPPQTQTTGLMGIGLLYYNTQHRRMSEVMLSEIEHIEVEDPSGSPDTLRDECYRLAAGFALGYINLGKGNDLRGLHDMRLMERLLSVAVGPKAVDLVHIMDQATAGATIAVALIFMKTMNEAVARKIDVPDTLPQFDYVRPDIFLLRTLAKHLIMWDNIRAEHRWIVKNIPSEFAKEYTLKSIKGLRSEHMPFYNIMAGLLWSIGLRYAGSGDKKVRDFLIKYLDQFVRLCRLPAIRYDARLARNTVRNCQDLIALSVSTVMAGTGDLDTFRRLRLLHGRVSPDTPYGSHLAAHLALGALFMGGGTYTFSTSNLAIASLVCAFYPLYPMDVQDNKAHLQAFRHFWVLATESRCLIVRDVDSHRAISLAITLTFRNGEVKNITAPCLLPEIDQIASIKTASPEHWEVTLDFEKNKRHLEAFQKHQTLLVRRRPVNEAHSSTFSAALVALNDAQTSLSNRAMWDWIFGLPSLKYFDRAHQGLVLPVDAGNGVAGGGNVGGCLDMQGTVVDDRVMLKKAVASGDRDRLRGLRVLFNWAETVQKDDERMKWLGKEVIETLKAAVIERNRHTSGSA